MCRVRARVLLVSALAALACAAAAPAHAASTATPCWKKVFNEWSRTNKISATYPLHCYHEALAHLKDFPDASIYSSFADDVHSALAAAVARRAHKQTPPSYLKQLADAKKHRGGTRTTSKTTTGRGGTGTTSTSPTPVETTAVGGNGGSDGGGGGIPTPLLVLGAIALLLLAAGAVGGAVRFNRTRRGA